jgi:hypothetical protein
MARNYCGSHITSLQSSAIPYQKQVLCSPIHFNSILPYLVSVGWCGQCLAVELPELEGACVMSGHGKIVPGLATARKQTNGSKKCYIAQSIASKI